MKRPTSIAASPGFPWRRLFTITTGKRRLAKKFEMPVSAGSGITMSQPVATGSST
jgi:hypothetical protein